MIPSPTVMVVTTEACIESLTEALKVSHAKLKHIKQLSGQPGGSLKGLLEVTGESIETLDTSDTWVKEEGLGAIAEW